MSLTLHYHPLSSFCHKVLVALHELETPFARHIVELWNPEARASFLAMWPLGKIPVLHDRQRDQIIPETSIIIEYLDRHYPGTRPLLPADETERLEARLWDRFFDLHVQIPMQKIVGDRLRAEGEHDPRGVADAVSSLRTAYDMIEQRMTGRSWVAGPDFNMADCAAAPALFYAALVVPLPDSHLRLAAYFERLMARDSVSATLWQAQPYFRFFPFKENIPARFFGRDNGRDGE